MQIKTAYRIPPSLCIKCRMAKLLCGLSYCPIAVSTLVKPKVSSIKGKELNGSSPPSVFVGRYGYPKINVYPSSPAVLGDTSSYENPNSWMEMGMEEFLSMRLSLFRGGVNFKVSNAADPGRNLQDLQVMALSSKPMDVEMIFDRALNPEKVTLDEHSPPMGPSAPLRKMNIGSPSIDRPVEKVYGDTDLLSAEAMQTLYNSGIDVSRISKILSIGALGISKNRKIVPTRWSITAADKNISDNLVSRIKGFNSIDEHLAYVRETPGNLFMAILSPANWMFEWGESWFPGSTWNYWGNEAEVEIDYEGYRGRKDYPGIGGCYYSSRLAVSETLDSMRRQSAATLWREIYPSFNLPVGVWYVRENLRAMFRSKPQRFSTFDEALAYISQFMKVPVKKWTAKSANYQVVRYGGLDRYL